jgi:ribose transport system substrate-binding protein
MDRRRPTTIWKNLLLIITVLIIGALVAGCAGSPAPQSEELAEEAPAAEASEGEAMEEMPEGYYAWDHGSRTWSPAAPNPTGLEVELDDNWQPQMRQASEDYVIGFANLSSDIDFSVEVERGIKKAAEEAGIEVFVTDNKFPDSELPLTNADSNVTRQVDLVLNFNVLGDLGPAIMEKYEEAGIPSVSIDVVHPTSLFFGADNCAAGRIGGEWMVEYAKANNWPADQIMTVGAEEPAVGEEPNFRISCFEDVVTAAFPETETFRIPGGAETEKSLENMTSWLTAHPDAQHVMTISINDQAATGILAAVEAAGRENDVAIMGIGGDAPAKAELVKDENAFKGSVGYFPERYGEFLIPMALDILEGKPLPAEVHMQHIVIDRSNFTDFYPDYE